MAVKGFNIGGSINRYDFNSLVNKEGAVTADMLGSDVTTQLTTMSSNISTLQSQVATLNDGYTNLHFADLLWSNPNPEQAFSAQVVSTNTSKYDFFLFVYRNSTDREVLETEIAIKGFRLHHASTLYRGSIKYLMSRTITVEEGSITFWNGTISTAALVESNDDSVLVPVKVYGIGVVKS